MKTNSTPAQRECTDLDDAIASLPSQIEPTRDLWQGIDRALEHKQHKPAATKRVGHLALVACVALLAGLMWRWQQVAPHLSTEALISQTMQTQKQQLISYYADMPATQDDWQQKLENLESAASAVREALKNDHENPELLSLLQYIYSQQLDLINQAHNPAWKQI